MELLHWRRPAWEGLACFSQLPNILMCPAQSPLLGLRAELQARAWIGWLSLRSAKFSKPKDVYSTSHHLPRPPDTAGLPITSVWETSQILRTGFAEGGPGQQV
eukprot:1139401-Pelagomonas_calceolata.AAC.1